MNRKIVSLALSLLAATSLFAQDTVPSSIVDLRSFFHDDDYVTLGEKLQFGNREMYLSGIYQPRVVPAGMVADEELKIFSKAIVYEKTACKIVAHPVLIDLRIINGKDEITLDHQFMEYNYGFVIRKFSTGLDFRDIFLAPYKGDKAIALGDPSASIRWNEEALRFELYKPDLNEEW